MQNFTAVSSAGPGRAVIHADTSDPAQQRMRARSARAADRTCAEAPCASPRPVQLLFVFHNVAKTFFEVVHMYTWPCI